MASETEQGSAWAEARIKALTGGDRISARFMRQDFFEYDPTFKLLIIGNHKPTLRNIDDAMRRRLNIVPFVLKPAVVDRELETKLMVEAPGILQWAIEGCLDWQANGLMRPEVVQAATAEYFSDQDTINSWLDECCDSGRRRPANLGCGRRSVRLVVRIREEGRRRAWKPKGFRGQSAAARDRKASGLAISASVPFEASG